MEQSAPSSSPAVLPRVSPSAQGSARVDESASSSFVLLPCRRTRSFRALALEIPALLMRGKNTKLLSNNGTYSLTAVSLKKQGLEMFHRDCSANRTAAPTTIEIRYYF